MIESAGFDISDYRALAEFRYQVRRFLRFSEDAARSRGVEPQQYLLLLAIKGLPEGTRARVGELAERLQLQHHSTVELVDRLEKQGMVLRKRSPSDRREVLISMTVKGEKLLRELAIEHKHQLQEEGPELLRTLRKVLVGSGQEETALRRASRGESRPSHVSRSKFGQVAR